MLMPPTTPQNSTVPVNTQSKQKWTLLGVLILLLPVLWFIVMMIWYAVYGLLFSPERGDSDYDWAPFFLFLLALPLGLFTLSFGILTLVNAKSVEPKSVSFRRRALWSSVGVTVLYLIAVIVLYSTSWGGRASLLPPTYEVTSAQAKQDAESVFNTILSSAQVAPTAKERTAYIVNDSKWCARWEYRTSAKDPAVTNTDYATVSTDVYTALDALDGWNVQYGSEFNPDAKGQVYAYKDGNGEFSGSSVTFNVNDYEHADQRTSNTVHVEVESACFAE